MARKATAGKAAPKKTPPLGERYLYGEEPIEINAGRRTAALTVRNTGDRAIQVCSHYHFFEANRALSFDREAAFGMHLDIPAGTAVRLEPGDTHHVTLVEYGGGLRVVGFSGLLNGGVRSDRVRAVAMERLATYGFADRPEPTKPEPTAKPATAKREPTKPATAKRAPAKKKGAS